MKSKYLYFCLITVCLSCNGSSEKSIINSGYKNTLHRSGSRLEIPIDKTTLNITSCLFLTETGTEVAYLNSNKNSIQFYSLDSLKLTDEIPLQQEGPDGVGSVFGFRALTRDSIYIVSTQYSKLFLVNNNGKVIQTIDYTRDKTGRYLAPAKIQSKAPMQQIEFVNGKIYLTGLALGNWTSMTNDQLLESSICIEIDTVKKMVEQLAYSYPNDYWIEGVREPVFSRVFDGENFIYSFYGDENIYVTKDHKNVQKIPASSNFIKNIPPYPNDGDMDNMLRYYCRTSYYSTIMYDKYRSVYYRFAFIGHEPEKDENLMKSVMNPTTPSIIVLDKDFQIISETRLDDNVYWVSNSFITEKGLFISKNHPQNPNANDDKLVFELFTIEEL